MADRMGVRPRVKPRLFGKGSSLRGQSEGSVLDIVYFLPSFLRRYKRWFR
jgi:hypothetical protein